MKVKKPTIFFLTGLGVVYCGCIDFMQLAWGGAKGIWEPAKTLILLGEIIFIVFFVNMLLNRKNSNLEVAIKYFFVVYAVLTGALYAWITAGTFIANVLPSIKTDFTPSSLLAPLFSIVPILFVVITLWGVKEKGK